MNETESNQHGQFAERLRGRTKRFAFEVLKLCRALPRTPEARVIGSQLLRAGMSVGANYRAVTRARSTAEFISKINIVIEEADESRYWLESLSENGIVQGTAVEALLRESDELIRILSRSQYTARKSPQSSSPRRLTIRNS